MPNGFVGAIKKRRAMPHVPAPFDCDQGALAVASVPVCAQDL